MKLVKQWILLLGIVLVLAACAIKPKTKINAYEVYNPGEQAIFPVSSTIFYNQYESMLIDAQFSAKDAQNVVELIQKSGKPLTLVYISHSDPDFYFGLETILKAYPNANVVATPETVERIKNTATDKIIYWRSVLGKKEVPSRIIIPNALTNNEIHFGKDTFEIKGNDSNRTYLWLPPHKIIVGGSLLSNNMHVWTADAKTAQQRLSWVNTIIDMQNLQPEIVLPGHYLGEEPKSIESLEFTRQYLKAFDYVLRHNNSSNKVIDKMKKLYPNLGGAINLNMSTKIILGKKAFK